MILLHFVHNYCTNSLEASKSFTGSNYRLVIQFILVTTPKNEDEFDWTSVEAISIPLFSSLSFLSFRETWREMNTTHINLSLAINPISLSRSSKNCDETNLCSLTKWWSGAGGEICERAERKSRYFRVPNRIPCLDNFSIQCLPSPCYMAFVFFSMEGNFLDCFFISWCARLSFCTGWSWLDRMEIIFSFLRACIGVFF